MRSTRAATGALIILMVLTVAGVALAPLVGTPVSGDDGNGEFHAFMEPRLTALLDSATTVDAMVHEKSRNILALRAESNRIEELVNDIDAWLAEHDVPAWAAPVVRDYRAGAAKVQTAIDAAYEAIRRFDFSRMASMIPVFDEGTELLQRAVDTLRDSAGGPSVVH
jgi:hypothetical protein